MVHHALLDLAGFGELGFQRGDFGVHVGEDGGNLGLFVLICWEWDLKRIETLVCYLIDGGTKVLMDLSLDHIGLELVINESVRGCPEDSHESSKSHSLRSLINLGALTDKVAAAISNTDEDVAVPDNDSFGNIHFNKHIVLKPK